MYLFFVLYSMERIEEIRLCFNQYSNMNNVSLIKTMDFGSYNYDKETVDTVMKYILKTLLPLDSKSKTTYICTFIIGGFYRAIIQSFADHDYASAIVFSYSTTGIIVYRVYRGYVYKCTTQWESEII